MFESIKNRRYLYKWTHPVIAETRTLHRVTNKVSKNIHMRPYEISPDTLERLICEYRRKGYNFISIDKLVSLVHRKYHFPYMRQKNVVFTLDDGYADNFENAYPIFKKYNVPFCIYITKQYVIEGISAEEGENYQILSESQLKRLISEPLCTIGCHTLSHPHLSRLSYDEQRHEIGCSKEWIEKTFGIQVNHFAYPYGDYNTDTITIVKNENFKSAVSVRKLKTRGNEDEWYMYQLPRIAVH